MSTIRQIPTPGTEQEIKTGPAPIRTILSGPPEDVSDNFFFSSDRPSDVAALSPRSREQALRKRAAEERLSTAERLCGKMIGGRYRVLGILGRGGMGVVYDAIHVELERPVAIKVLLGGIRDDGEARWLENRIRFEHEAKILCKIHHPNVVGVFDFGRLNSGEPFLVMERLQGRDLAQRLMDDPPPTPNDVVRILRPIAHAVDAIHSAGYVHRDVKPANIFFTDEHVGAVKLVDFGLVRVEANDAQITSDGVVVGTVSYVPPEVASGERPNRAADVYSVAVIAFEMLARTLPWKGEPLAIFARKVASDAPRISQYLTRECAALDEVIAKALARDPVQRYLSAGEFVESLAAAVGDLGAVAEQVISQPHIVFTNSETKDTKLDAAIPASERETQTNRRQGGTAQHSPRSERSKEWWMVAVALFGIGVAWYKFTQLDAAHGFATEAATTSAGPLPREVLTPVTEPEPSPSLTSPGLATAVPAEDVARPVQARTPARPRGLQNLGSAGASTSVSTPVVETAVAETTPSHAPVVAEIEPETRPTRAAEPVAHPEDDASARSLVAAAGRAMLGGEFAVARDLFRRATEVAPSMPATWRGLGLASERLSMHPEANRAYRQYLRLAPHAVDANEVQARIRE